MTDKVKILLPNGEVITADESPATERKIQREHEETRFLPVIIKRSDQVMRHPDDTLEHAITEGLEQLGRGAFSLTLSALAAGMIVGFSAMAVAVVTTLTAPFEIELLTRVATAVVYPTGFVVCVMSGAQLFTEHTATAVYPVLDRRSTVWQMLRLWILVAIGNLLGAVLIAALLSRVDAVVYAHEGYVLIGHHLTQFDSSTLFLSAMVAGWLMALGAWLVMATPPTFSQIASIFIVTFLIGIGGLHHSIAGSAEMMTAYFISDEFTLAQAGNFVLIALLGNLCGGSIFVAVLNYGHIRRTQPANINGDSE
jgi:formate/nitrite transporter FocA (FNT family)